MAVRLRRHIEGGFVLLDKTDFYDWQLEAFDRIEGRSAVLSAPTGSGKTLVAYLWAGLLDREGQVC